MRPLLAAATALGALLLAAACSNQPPDDPRDYAATLTADRAAKDAAFQSGSDSPIPADRKPIFLPLAYYPIDPEYNVVAGLTPATERIEVMMPTSSGQMRRMLRIGTLSFNLKGQDMTLVAFTENNLDRLFLPFSDLTSGTETYAAGRFLELDRTATNLYELDFNRAYIPFCYYNESFECPYPPPENRLKVPIRAGERMKPAA